MKEENKQKINPKRKGIHIVFKIFIHNALAYVFFIFWALYKYYSVYRY